MSSTPSSETENRPAESSPLLSVDGLKTHIRTDSGTVHAVDGVSFEIDAGETVAIVGESGSGKSMTCKSLTRIVPQPPAEIVEGTVEFDGTELTGLGRSELRTYRGNRIAHIFQNPQQALDPVYTVGDQIEEAITIHDAAAGRNSRERAIELLGTVGIPDAGRRIDDYPHEFSGGMRQRIAIAIALAADPELLIADEPTTAVDVTVQARLIELLRDLGDGGMSMLLVTHDLRVVAALADRVLVMFGGTIVERGPTEALFERPAHPYTRVLFDSYNGEAGGPDPKGQSDRSSGSRAERPDRDRSARETIPNDGCRFRRECPYAIDACETTAQPRFEPIDGRDDHAVSCVYYAPERDPEPILAGDTARLERSQARAEVSSDE